MKREEYEERMKDSKYRELTVTNCDSGKDYVFVSYRGNSWKTVLTDIVYKLQKEYKLRIYFDKEFASETNIWIEQFIKNMDSSHCKACLCFFDEGYVTSYATLLELMHAMNPRSKLGDSIFPISFPIDWDGLNDATWDTGLGVRDPNNPGWKEEKKAFDREFESIKRRYPDVADYYYEGAELRGCDCKDIMIIIQPKNKRDYVDEEAYFRQFIVEPLRKKCPGVFEEANVPEYQVTIVNNGKKTTFQITEGGFVPKQDVGVRDGLVFKGWFVEGTEKEWNFDNPVERDMELVAKWDEIEPTGSITVCEKTSLKDFEKLCEKVDFCEALGEARNNTQHGGKGLFDYLMAALLRGCDADMYDKKNQKVLKLSAYNYNRYAVAENAEDPKTSNIQYPWTWTTACRKALKKEDIPARFINEKGKIKSGKLEDFNTIFEKLDPEMSIGEVLEKFRAKDRGFDTKNNDLVFDAWNLIKRINLGKRKKGLGEIL